MRGPGSVVGIATAYGLDGPGIESRWGEIFPTSPDRPWSPPSLLYNGYRVFPGGKVLQGRDADPSPLLVQRSKIEQSYASTLPKGLRGLWKGETYLYQHARSPEYQNSNLFSEGVRCEYCKGHRLFWLRFWVLLIPQGLR